MGGWAGLLDEACGGGRMCRVSPVVCTFLC